MIDCGMCGHSFTREEGVACSKGCPMATGCGMVTCPGCGHEFPPESKIVNFVTNLVRRGARSLTPQGGQGVSRRLVECKAGERVLVGSVEGSAARIDRLASLGILPGVELRLQQTRPVVVVECDETILALERSVATDVVVAACEAAVPEAAQ